MKLEGKVAIVTGGADGIGKNACKELLKNGSKVSFCDIGKVNGEKTSREFVSLYGEDKVMFIESDITDHHKFNDVFRKTLEKFGQIDVVINNAGVLKEGKDWRNTVFVNLMGTIEGCKNADTYMSLLNGGKGGVVVNMASIAGLNPFARFPVYGSTKAGVISFTQSNAARAEQMKTGLRFICVCPDIVDIGMGKRTLTPEEMLDAQIDIASPFHYDPSCILSVEFLVKEIVKMLEQENNNGGIIKVTNKRGFEYVHGEPEGKKKS